MPKRLLNTETLLKRLKLGATLIDLADYFVVSPSVITKMLYAMDSHGYKIAYDSTTHEMKLQKDFTPYSRVEQIPTLRNLKAIQSFTFGAIGDTHLASKFSRLDILDAIYKDFHNHRITKVFHTGNIIDGFIKRINGNDVLANTLDGQIKILAEQYPSYPGITTYFVTGDDHEGWFQKDLGLDVGYYIERRLRDKYGRKDLVFLGFMEADINIAREEDNLKLRVQHPGGGSAYALSYAPQKLIESLMPEEKPDILLLGHYHKSEYLPAYNGVHVIQTGTTMDQTPFMRKKKIKSMLGAWRVTVNLQAKTTKDTPIIHSLDLTYLDYKSMGFYKENDYYKV